MTDPILVSDGEREVALELLRGASVDGRLTLEDLAERAELVHLARTRDDLATATAGLEVAILGSVEIVVPEGVDVIPSGGGLLFSQDVQVPAATRAGAPVLRLRVSGVLGSMSVRSRGRR